MSKRDKWPPQQQKSSDTEFGYVCTVTLEYDLGSRSWHALESWRKIVWNIIQIQQGSEELWPNTDFGYECTVTLALKIWSWVKVMTHPWAMNSNCVKYHLHPTWQWGVMAQTQIFGMCVPWPWLKRYSLESRSWHTLESWTAIVWNIIQIKYGSEELWPGHTLFGMWALCPWPGGMTLGQCHDTPLGHWK